MAKVQKCWSYASTIILILAALSFGIWSSAALSTAINNTPITIIQK